MATKRRNRSDVIARRRLQADRPRRAGALNAIAIDGRRLDMQVGDRLQSATLERRMDSTPNSLTLTLWDGDGRTLSSGVLGERVMSRVAEVELDGLVYSITGFGRAASTLSITTESALVTILKRDGRDKPVRRSRSGITRAGFCASLVRRAGVPVVVLDEDVIQPIKGQRKISRELAKARRDALSESRQASEDPKDRGRGRVAQVKGSGLTVKGAPTSQQQRRVIAQVREAGALEGAKPRAVLGGIVCVIQEDEARNRRGGDKDSTGAYQQRASQGWPATNDVITDGREFFRRANKVFRENPSKSVGWCVDEVQRSYTYGTASQGRDYDQWLDEARRWLAAAGGDVTEADGAAWIKSYGYERRKGESTWACCNRLLDEVNWRIFEREGVMIVASDTALARASSSLRLRRGSELVEPPDFEAHRGLTVEEATVRAFVGRYQADPGEVADVDDLPILDGKPWLISVVNQQLATEPTAAEITVVRATEPLPEPASVVQSRSASPAETGGISVAGGAKALVDDAVRIAQQAGGDGVYVGSSFRAQSTTSSGNPSDHSADNEQRAARDIGIRGIDLITGPPSARLDRAVVALGKAFDRDYGTGHRRVVDTFDFRGYRVQIIWRTPEYGGHMGHIHIGAHRIRQ